MQQSPQRDTYKNGWSSWGLTPNPCIRPWRFKVRSHQMRCGATRRHDIAEHRAAAQRVQCEHSLYNVFDLCGAAATQCIRCDRTFKGFY